MKIKSICIPSFNDGEDYFYRVGFGGVTEIRDTSPTDTNRHYDVYRDGKPFATLENCPVIIMWAEEAEA